MKKTLQTLIKLQKALVDEQRLQLNKLRDILEEIEKRIVALEIEKAREQVAAENNPNAVATYGAFLKRITTRGRELEKERRVMQFAVDQAHAKLTELFEEQKRYEIAEEARVAAELKEEKHRERLDLDEVGGITHERQKNTEKRD